MTDPTEPDRDKSNVDLPAEQPAAEEVVDDDDLTQPGSLESIEGSPASPDPEDPGDPGDPSGS